MITIDGSFGEGGGQILRTSLALSLVTGQPFRIEKIRAGRKNPGLLRQHLTAVNAAQQISQAAVEGAGIGSTQLSFTPGEITPGEYAFAVGTAGSTTLVLQTVLPSLLRARAESRLTLEGGTHNPFAPPFNFLVKAFLPLLNRLGARVEATLARYGFYPAGGGKLEIRIAPASQLTPFELLERGEIVGRRAQALVANLPRSVGERELKVIGQKLNWPAEWLRLEEVKNSNGPGNLVSVEIESANVAEVFTGFGERGVTAEAVAIKAIQEARRYLASDAAVGEYLADQLLIPLALAGGGAFTTVAPSRHTTTNIAIIRKFLPVEITTEELSKRAWKIAVKG
ncbi:MAG: RNA 3'-terminal phosphate cyclase [Acidobacteria bacterium]|nr:RNA 3'-terminal phosphate cyclase [Acidobacteriota bacterium]MBI3425526.1 RNA 3'-terminal phosphate cyclase [Acidobacteriota bacterium]